MLLCFIAKNRQKCGVAIIILSFLYGCHISLAEQWRIEGKGPEGGGGLEAPLFLDQTEARRAEKKLGDDRRHSPPPPSPLSLGLDPALLRSSSFFLHGQKMNYKAVKTNLPSNPGPFQRHL